MSEASDQEIEITPEMAAAGAEEVMDYDGKTVTAREVAIRTYRAMERQRRLQHPA